MRIPPSETLPSDVPPSASAPCPPEPPHPKRPIGIWFYAAVLLCLGGAMVAFAALLLPTIGFHAKMWLPMLYLTAVVLVGTMSAALGAGLWMRLRIAWTAAVCLFGGGSLYLAALCTLRLGWQIVSGEPLTQYGIPWRTTVMVGLVFSYLLFNRDVRTFFEMEHPLPRRERLRLGIGGAVGLLLALGLHGLLLVTLLLFPGGRPVTNDSPLPPSPTSEDAPPVPANPDRTTPDAAGSAPRAPEPPQP